MNTMRASLRFVALELFIYWFSYVYFEKVEHKYLNQILANIINSNPNDNDKMIMMMMTITKQIKWIKQMEKEMLNMCGSLPLADKI